MAQRQTRRTSRQTKVVRSSESRVLRHSMLKGAGSAGATRPPIETRAHDEHISDEEMDDSLMRTVQQTVDQALMELEEAGVNGSLRAVTETAVTTATMQSLDVSNTAGPSHRPKAHSTPYHKGVKTAAPLDCSDNEAECSVLTRRPLYQSQVVEGEKEKEEEEEVTDGGDTASPAAQTQAPSWMNLHICELFLLVAAGLCLTLLFWYTLQHYKAG